MKKIFCTILLLFSIQVAYCQTATLNIRALIQGYYTGMGTMIAVVDPVNHPNICDSMRVNLLDTAGPDYNVVFTTTSVISTTGYGSFTFPSTILNETYFIQLYHRNALTVFSKYPVTFNNSPIFFDFTVLPLQLCESAANSGDGFALMYSGDVNHDGYIDSKDAIIIKAQLESVYPWGYLKEDINGDYSVDIVDLALVLGNVTYPPLWGGRPNSCLGAVGVNEFSHNADFRIFPNPVRQTLNITFPTLLSRTGKLEILNILGEKLIELKLSQENSQIPVDVSQLEQGIYLCRWVTDKEIFTAKFIKE